MTINFYLDDESETTITSFDDMASNPFNVGDLIHLRVDPIFPNEFDKYSEASRGRIKENASLLEEKFKYRDVVIVRESKHVRFNLLDGAHLTIDYICRYP